MKRTQSPTSQVPSWLPFLLLAALALAGCSGSSAPVPPAVTSDVATGTVTIEVVDGPETHSYQVTDVAAGSTVESVMRSLDEVEVSITGSGLTAFVDAIDGESTSSSEGWTYRIDGEFANEGIGSTTVDPPATIRWTFGEME